MTALIFILCGLITCTSVYFSYSKVLGNYSISFIAITGMLSGLLWGVLAKNTTNNDLLIKYGLYWDIGVTLIYAIIPIIFFDVRPSTNVYLGGLLALVGLVLIKLG